MAAVKKGRTGTSMTTWKSREARKKAAKRRQRAQTSCTFGGPVTVTKADGSSYTQRPYSSREARAVVTGRSAPARVRTPKDT